MVQRKAALATRLRGAGCAASKRAKDEKRAAASAPAAEKFVQDLDSQPEAASSSALAVAADSEPEVMRTESGALIPMAIVLDVDSPAPSEPATAKSSSAAPPPTAQPAATASRLPTKYRRRGYSGSSSDITEAAYLALPPKDKKKYNKVKEDDVAMESMFSLIISGQIDDTPTLLKLLADLDRNVRVAALQALSKTLGSGGLEPHAGAIVARLADHEEPVREAALEVLRTLDDTVLAQHVQTVLDMENDADDDAVRDAAGRCLDMMDQELVEAALAPPTEPPAHAPTAAAASTASATAATAATAAPAAPAASSVRSAAAPSEAPAKYRRRGYSGSGYISEAAYRALPPKDRKKYVQVKEGDGEMESMFALIKHGKISDPPTLLKLLADLDRNVRVAALQALSKTLGSGGLEPHAGAIVARLADHEEPVREAALEVLRTLDDTVLAQHVQTVLDMENDADDDAVRDAAGRCLDMMDQELVEAALAPPEITSL